MFGRRKEVTKDELQRRIQYGFGNHLLADSTLISNVPVGFLPSRPGVPALLTDQHKYQSDGLMEDLYR